jgi:hypothetical protein
MSEDDDGLVAVLEGMAHAVMAQVEGAGVAGEATIAFSRY